MRRSMSPSMAADYEECPKRWARFNAGEVVPNELQEDPEMEVRLRFGSAWHETIEKWLKAGTFDRKELIELWAAISRNHLPDWRGPLAIELKKRAYPFLQNFVKKMVELELCRKPLVVERRLAMDLEAGWQLSGRLDAAWQHGAPTEENGGGLIEVVDWKTNRGVKGEAMLRGDWQMRTYALLVMEHYDADRVMVTQHFVMANKRTTVMFERPEVEGPVLRRYSSIADQVDRGHFPQVNDARCESCPFTRAGRPCPGSPPAMQQQQQQSGAVPKGDADEVHEG